MVAVAIAKTQWNVTPSLRVAAFSHRNKQGEPVLVDVDLKTKLCQHGETSSTIRTWLQLDAQARAEGKDQPSRGTSKCDCTNTHGLQNCTDTGPVEPPTCVYDVLASSGAEKMTVPGEQEPAYRLGERDAYLSANGDVFCGAHLNKLPPLTKALRPRAFKAKRGTCGCCLTLPGRASIIPLGRIAARKKATSQQKCV